jgi:hypothetical protein
LRNLKTSLPNPNPILSGQIESESEKNQLGSASLIQTIPRCGFRSEGGGYSEKFDSPGGGHIVGAESLGGGGHTLGFDPGGGGRQPQRRIYLSYMVILTILWMGDGHIRGSYPKGGGGTALVIRSPGEGHIVGSDPSGGVGTTLGDRLQI